MIHNLYPLHKAAKSYARVENCVTRLLGVQRVLQNTVQVVPKVYKYRQHCSHPYQTKMFKIKDYDCIGFDLDNTLLRYNVTNLVQLEYDLMAKFLVEERNYSPKYLMKALGDKDFDFMQKGLMLDFERGNILRISPDGLIQRACHGSKLLNPSEIASIYPNQKWDVIDAFCNDMLATWNGPLSMKMRSLLDYFDIPASLIFARAVDTLDEEHGAPLNEYKIWPDMLDSMIDMFDREQFQFDKGHFFPALKKNPEIYLHKCSAKVISWLQELKNKNTLFLITGSNADFADFVASYALGEDWKSFFDISICYAKKPGFFTNNRPFFDLKDYIEMNVVSAQDLKQGGVYSQGNWKSLLDFLKRVSKKNDPHCLYIGDNVLQDIYVPTAYVQCDTVAVIEEQLSEGMVHQRLSHPDEKILNSTFWGSYFRLKDLQTNVDSFWGHIIKNYSKICIPEVDFIVDNPPDKPLECFKQNERPYSGYHPAMPLSISDLK